MAYTKQNTRIVRTCTDTKYANGTGTAIAVKIEALLESVFINDANSSDTKTVTPLDVVRFDLLDPALASTAITAAGKTVTYLQFAALYRQMVLDRANAAGIT